MIMTAEKLISILQTVPPETKIELAGYYYADSEDSVGTYDFVDLEVVSMRKDRVIILSSSIIAYPMDRDDYTVISQKF